MIGPVVDATLPLFRRVAASLRTSTCTIERLTSTWDEAQQKTVTTWATIHAALPCHLETMPAVARSLVADQGASPDSPLVKVAHDVTDVKADDRVTVVGHEPMWVTGVAHDDSSHPVELIIQCRRVK